MDSSAAPARHTAQPAADLLFLANYEQSLYGQIQAGERLNVSYAEERVACRRERLGVPIWTLDSYIRFQPEGELYRSTGTSFSVPVPPDATGVELWFRSSNLMACHAWDSRYGQNYQFPVQGPTRSLQNVRPRAGAVVKPAVVNTFRQSAKKVVRYFTSDPSEGRELDTRLAVRAWVHNIAPEKKVWVDVHVFDDTWAVAKAATFPLLFAGPAGGGGEVFNFDDQIYQGSGGGPGSAWNNPDARNVQYRLYYEVNGQLFTDGILHQDEVEDDDHVWNAENR